MQSAYLVQAIYIWGIKSLTILRGLHLEAIHSKGLLPVVYFQKEIHKKFELKAISVGMQKVSSNEVIYSLS